MDLELSDSWYYFASVEIIKYFFFPKDRVHAPFVQQGWVSIMFLSGLGILLGTGNAK